MDKRRGGITYDPFERAAVVSTHELSPNSAVRERRSVLRGKRHNPCPSIIEKTALWLLSKIDSPMWLPSLDHDIHDLSSLAYHRAALRHMVFE